MNKWIGTGRLTKDVETRYSQNGENTCIAHYTLAVDRRFKQEGQPTADFINCVAFGKNGEFADKYFKKGTKIAVEGRIQTGNYKDKNGNTVYTTEIVIDAQEFCESKKDTQDNAPSAPVDSDGFMNIPDGIDEELPFL